MKTEFEIGDLVEVEFEGRVEDVPVTVCKRLFVFGVAVTGAINGRPAFGYSLCEKDPRVNGGGGKTYNNYPVNRLRRVEPVIEAIVQAGSCSTP